MIRIPLWQRALMSWQTSLVFFVLLMSTSLVSCSWNRDTRSPVLIIAVESLGFHEVSCGSNRFLEKEMAGYQVFCENSVRFTHAFTPSLMSQASLASILTGLYPMEHKVLHNGSHFLSGEFVTIAEKAVGAGLRTAFFSGGAPIWHKSGLAQGFEVFEDNISVDIQRLYRPARENFDLFLNWLDEDVGKGSFFSLVYINDLLFSDVTTRNDLGEIRERSFAGQVKEVGESLNYLYNEMSRRGVWDSSHVILVGMNGRAERDRPGEIDTFSMHSNSTQVGLFIKPARKKRDKGLEWSLDKNVSLVDLGATLFDLLGFDVPESELDTTALTSALINPKASWEDDRNIWLESSWPVWRNLGARRVAARKSQHLVIFDEQLKLFNTLIDRFEVTPVPASDPVLRTILPNLKSELTRMGLQQWSGLPESLIEKLRLARVLWRSNGFSPENLKRLRFLARIRPWDAELVGWQAFGAIETKDWVWLNQLGKSSGSEIWTYLASRQNKRDHSFKAKGCEELFLWKRGEFKTPSPQLCEDRLFLEGVEWVLEKDRQRGNRVFESFWRNYRKAKTEEWVARYNYANSLVWDTSLRSLDEPSLIDLYLLLPRNANFLERLKTRISGKDFRFQLSSPFEL